jgi:hypothetical protein
MVVKEIVRLVMAARPRTGPTGLSAWRIAPLGNGTVIVFYQPQKSIVTAAVIVVMPLGQDEECPLRLPGVVASGERHSHSIACQ